MFLSILYAAILWMASGCERAQPNRQTTRDLTLPMSNGPTVRGSQTSPHKEPPSTAEVGPLKEPSSPRDEVEPAHKEASELREDAEQALAKGDYQAALSSASAAMRKEPADPANVFLTATVLSSQHRYHEAVRMLDRLAEQVPDASLPVLGQTAEWLVTQGDWQSAEARFRRVIEAAPEAAIAHRQLAQLLLRQGRRVDAGKHLRQLCRLGDVSETELVTLLTISQPLPDDADREAGEAIGALGEAWSLASRQQWPEAIARLEPTARQSAAQYGLLGRIHVERRDPNALRQWESGIVEPAWRADPQLQLAIGASQLANQEHELAAASLRLAVQHDATDSLARSLLADALHDDALHDDAVQAERDQAIAQAEAVLRTQTLAAQIIAGKQDKAPLVQDLIAALQSLERPFESLAWQVLDTIYQSGLTAEAKQQRINEINAQRLKLLKG